MFENIFHQKKSTSALSLEVEKDRLPGAALFIGPEYSGKSSTALELFRQVGCKGDRSWSCNCSFCRLHRGLNHPDTLFVGPRNFLTDIRACSDVYLRDYEGAKTDYARWMFLRSLRKLLKRFDPILWEGEESRLSKIQANLEALGELCQELEQNQQKSDEKSKKKALKVARENSKKILDTVKLDPIPIFMVRNIQNWLHFSSPQNPRFVLMENGDRMLDGARNALLKTLEEPPKGLLVVMTTLRRGAVLPTILSRMRQYPFAFRRPEQEKEVLAKIFRTTEDVYSGLREYFLEWETSGETEQDKSLHHISVQFLDGVFQKDEYFVDMLENLQIEHNILKKGKLPAFLEELEIRLEKHLLKGTMPQGMDIHQVHSAIQKAHTRMKQFNQNQALVLENLYFALRDLRT
jgi:DNA polymerase III delta prime subunit